MTLKQYRKKRTFEETKEPRGRVSKKKMGDKLSYVIQKHDASRLHYDLRLEMNQVLKSWAVPKGPSLDPSTKRLAIEVENHPLEYQSFEGIIPKGHYGGGTVMVWDRGFWKPHEDPNTAYRKGDITFQILGKKLHGLWKLVKIKSHDDKKKNEWLFFKLTDKFANQNEDITKKRPLSIVTRRSLDKIALMETETKKKKKVNK
jgi:bifunctional non-homologous end joining protein LigD